MRYRFENIELDLDAYELRRDGKPLRIRKKTFDVLRYLLEHRDRVVTKQELLDKLWTGEHVSDSTVPWYISNLRKTLGRDERGKGAVETVHGRGYRFKKQVLVDDALAGAPLYGSLRPPPASESDPFVGREEILTRMTAALGEAAQGQGKILLLRGVAGIGKTRCAAELDRQMSARGVSVWMGRCPETAGQPAFWPWILLLRGAAGNAPADSPVALEAGRLLQLLTPGHEATVAGARADDPSRGTDRFWLYDRLSDFLRTASVIEPRILILDDIHWADEASLELLSFMAPEVATRRLLFVLTLREHEPTTSRAELFHRLFRSAEQIQLVGLSQRNIEQYLSQSGRPANVRRLGAVLHRKTGGNPLFLHEIVRWLASDAEKTNKPITAEALQGADVPDVIRELLQRRLAAVDATARLVLDMASAVGRRFDLGLTARALELEPAAVLGALDSAVAAGLVVREPPSRFRFSHDLFHEAAYELLTEAKRASYHQRIALRLLERPDSDAVMGEIAFHLHRALPVSDSALAVRCAVRAAERSAEVHAHGDAATHYRRALDAVSFDPRAGARQQAELWLSLCRQERFSGDVDSSDKSGDRALQLARAHALFDIVFEIAFFRRRSFLVALVPNPTVLEALQAAVEQVPPEQARLRGRLLSQLALTHPHSADMARCRTTCEQALALAREQGDAELEQVALNASLYALSGPDDIDTLRRTTDRILELGSEGGELYYHREALLARILAGVHSGDMAEAERATERYGQMVQRAHMTEGIWLYQRLVAQKALLQGRFRQAAEQLALLAQQGERIGISYAEIFHQTQAGYMGRACGGMAEWAQSGADAVLPAARAWLPTLTVVVAWIAEAGLPERVREEYRILSAQKLEDIPRNYVWLYTLVNRTLAALVFDDRPRIRELYELLSPYADLNTPDGLFLCEGSVAHFLGLLAAALGEDASAFRHFEQAVQANGLMGMPPHQVRSRVAFAEYLAGSGRKKDRALLKQLAGQAQDDARQMGMAPFVERAQRVLFAV